jgi:uncharacterized protein
MKKILFLVCFLYSVCALAQIDKVIPKRPVPPKLVNDFTNTLTPEQKEALEQKLYRYDDTTSNQVAVVIIKSLEGNSVEDVALEILRQWGVGNKDKNNGIVVLVAKDDRKIRIEVGYGLEGAVTDVVASHIIQEDIVPNFKADNYYRGLDEATDNIIKAAEGRYEAPEGYSQRGGKKGISIGTIIFIVVILIIVMNSSGGSRGGGMMSRRGYRGWWGPVFPGGGWTGGGSSGGGGWSGGGGGGFGGFGGGSGGGGGSSGSW